MEGLLKKYGTRDEDKTPFSESHAEFLHALLRTPTKSSGGYFSYAALGNLTPEAGFSGIINKQKSSASSDTKDGMVLIRRKPSHHRLYVCMLLHPLSRGNTHITRSNPEIPSQIDATYFSHALDLGILARSAILPRIFPPFLFLHFSNLPEGEITVRFLILRISMLSRNT